MDPIAILSIRGFDAVQRAEKPKTQVNGKVFFEIPASGFYIRFPSEDSMIPSFTLDEKFAELLHHPRLKIFNRTYKHLEKKELIERIVKVTHQQPIQFSDIVSGVLHNNFKVSIYDTELLQHLRESSLFFNTYPHLALPSPENSEITWWAESASKLETLVREKSAFRLIHLPCDLLFDVMTRLSLKEIAHLNHATSFKRREKNGKPTHNPIESPIKDIFLSRYPRLIVEAPQSSMTHKIHSCLALSSHWHKSKQLKALAYLFAFLEQPKQRSFRSDYLQRLTDPKLFQAFLSAQHPRDQMLSLDIASPFFSKLPAQVLSISSPFNPSIYWDRLIHAYMHVEELAITTALHNTFEDQNMQFFFNTLNTLKQVRKLQLKIYNFTQPTIYFSRELELYCTVIQAFPSLTVLKLILENRHPQQRKTFAIPRPSRSLPGLQPLQLIRPMLTQLRNNTIKLLNSSLKVREIHIALDCFSSIPIETFDSIALANLAILSTMTSHILKMPHISEIRLIFPLAERQPAFEERILQALQGSNEIRNREILMIDGKLHLILNSP